MSVHNGGQRKRGRWAESNREPVVRQVLWQNGRLGVCDWLGNRKACWLAGWLVGELEGELAS